MPSDLDLLVNRAAYSGYGSAPLVYVRQPFPWMHWFKNRRRLAMRESKRTMHALLR